MSGPIVVAELVRNGVVEGRHHGSVAAVGEDGATLWAVGSVDVPMFPRSCLKPLQAVAMLESGLQLSGELLALACGSHSGEQFHVDGVRRILGGVGLTEDTLRNPVDLPLDDETAHELLRAGGAASRLTMNCSGKHAAMLATCVVNDWDTESYLAPDHPLQRAIRSTVQEWTGEPAFPVAVDGCGAPALGTTLVGLARAFSRLATVDAGAGRAVVDAVRAHPAWVSGSTRDERDLLAAVPGAVAKAGAEGCYAVALADGRSVAVKIEDGASRARRTVMNAALSRLGVHAAPGVDVAGLAAAGHVAVLGGGRPVGEVRATL